MTPGSTPPWSSLTVPVILPVGICANRLVPNRTRINRKLASFMPASRKIRRYSILAGCLSFLVSAVPDGSIRIAAFEFEKHRYSTQSAVGGRIQAAGSDSAFFWITFFVRIISKSTGFQRVVVNWRWYGQFGKIAPLVITISAPQQRLLYTPNCVFTWLACSTDRD